MKNKLAKLYSILFFLLCIIISLNAQQLVEENNQWNIVVYPTFSPNTSSYSIKIGEEISIEDIVYNKIYRSTDSLNTNWQFINTYLRQDTTSTVYIKEYEGDEVPLYDFSLELNDTFFVSDFCYLIVNEIDSISLNNGEMRKRLKMERQGADIGFDFWIEGIGSKYGVISHFDACATDYADDLLCFYSNSELLYPSFPASCFITPVREIEQTNIKVFPNPLEDILVIEDDELSLKAFAIYDASGKKIMCNSLTSNSNTINLEELKSGFYILRLIDKKGNLFSQKLIKE